jgi:hypothetical protein
MAQGANELWMQAYRQQFGTDPDADMAEYGEKVEEWRASWQAGYDAGEEWATSMVQGQPNAGQENAG